MTEFKGVKLCIPCNDKYGRYYNFFQSASAEFQKEKDRVRIECPGATIYDASNTRVVQGVKWNDPRDFSKGYCIIGKPVYAPAHKKYRLVPQDRARNISRCQACQDLTVRMRIFNQQKGRDEYQQNSPLMPRDPRRLDPDRWRDEQRR
jgi:hypothetical protein